MQLLQLAALDGFAGDPLEETAETITKEGNAGIEAAFTTALFTGPATGTTAWFGGPVTGTTAWLGGPVTGITALFGGIAPTAAEDCSRLDPSQCDKPQDDLLQRYLQPVQHHFGLRLQLD